MAERDRAPERVQALGVESELLAARHHLGGEGLVELHHVDVGDLHARLLQHALDGRDRAEPHDLRPDRRDGRRDDPRPRLRPHGARLLLGHDEHCGGAVVQRAGVAGRDRPVGPERGLELGQHFHGRARARAVVARDLGAVVESDGRDLGVEVARVARGDGAVLRRSGPLVLRLPRHLAALGDVLGGEPHRDVDVVGRALRAVELGMRVVGRDRREARDGLHARRHALGAPARLDRVEGHPDRLEGGGAEAVDGRRGDVMVDAGQQRGVAADVVAGLAHLKAAAHHQVVGLAEVDLRVALDERAEGHRGEVVCADVFEGSLGRAADGRSDGVDDDGFGHPAILWWGPLITYRFTTEDLLHIRFAISPLFDLTWSTNTLRDPARRSLHLPWVRAARQRLEGLDWALLGALAADTGGYVPDFIAPPPSTPLADLKGELERVRATPPARVAQEVAWRFARDPAPEEIAPLLGEPERLLEVL